MANTDWYIFTGDEKNKGIDIDTLNKIAPAPSWRKSKKSAKDSLVYLASEEEKAVVNASIYLRRPLLLTGKAGTGKSSLAYAIANELGLELYHWAINSKSTLEEGLYSYDAISRLQDAQLKKIQGDDTTKYLKLFNWNKTFSSNKKDDITKYLKLAPLGKAFASNKKAVLLIDELDKSDIDLPNDLLHILEENKFEIDVLKRYSNEKPINLGTEKEPILIKNGEKEIDIDNFPIIIMTSNGERDFPPAFMRRCLHHEMTLPDETRLIEIVSKHLKLTEDDKILATIEEIVKDFVSKRDGLDANRQKSDLATDQLLNALYLRLKGNVNLNLNQSQILKDVIWRSLD